VRMRTVWIGQWCHTERKRSWRSLSATFPPRSTGTSPARMIKRSSELLRLRLRACLHLNLLAFHAANVGSQLDRRGPRRSCVFEEVARVEGSDVAYVFEIQRYESKAPAVTE
jgi:hypothetical protein